MTQNRKTNIETGLQALGYVAPLLVILGIIKAQIYYLHFEIVIFQFIGAEEILFLFVEDIVYFLSQLAYISPIVIVGSSKDILEYPKMKFFKRILIFSIATVFILLILGTKWGGNPTCDSFHNYITYGWWGILFAILSYSAACLIYLIYNWFKLQELSSLITFIVVLTYSITVIILYNKSLVSFVSGDCSKYEGTTIIYENAQKIDTLVSDHDKYYIGQVNNFVFFHSETDSSCLAIPMKQIQIIKMQVK